MSDTVEKSVSPPVERAEEKVEEVVKESAKDECTASTTSTPGTYTCSCSCTNCLPKVTPCQPPVMEVVVKEAEPRIPNFFGRIRERNLTFCVDTSGSMYLSLSAVKEQLAEFLVTLAAHPLPTRFNLVEFSTEVTQWSDKMVTCTPQTIAVATDWIKGLEAKTGTNTLDALMTALNDDLCDAVVLVTDGMPDQNPVDILDQVALVADNRPIHCYYIRNGVDPDDFSTEFLQDLAMETYGSFHVVTVAKHGAVERITPIYRADSAAEHIIRTTSGTSYPSNIGHHERCSVTTSLDQPVDYVVDKVGPDYIIETDSYDPFPPGYATYRYPDSRYYYSYYYPYLGWSRYRANDSWPKSANKIIDIATCKDLPPHMSPGAGSLLIGTKVLARRHEDGYFYKGRVKSQIFDKKFLVEFGPCKHGKFRETMYQETYLYDIVSLDDALRHSVMAGDKVLSPWEPDAERYAPGSVIEGQEKRSSDIGSGDETSLVVSLDHDGRSVRLAKDLAVWIPSPLHERITFELKLPAKVRKEIATTEDYPLHSLPGYPRSGMVPYPEDYDRFEEVIVERPGVDGGFREKGLYRAPYFVPLYPVHYKNKVPASAVRSNGVEELIPGTGLTKDQLNEKVVQQLLEHKMMLEEIKKDQAELRDQIIVDGHIDKLLSKRGTVDENTLTSTKKSVTFNEEAKEGEAMDSGCSVGDVLSDLDLSDLEFEDLPKDVACGTDAPSLSRSQRRRVRSAGKLPPWKYWKNKPAPSLMESNNFGKYRVGPFRDCLMAIPMEARASKYSNQGIVEWTDPMLRCVTQTAGHQREATVRDSMGYMPRPPPPKPESQGPGIDISLTIGAKDEGAREVKKNRRNFRRQRVIERERTWEKTHLEKETGTQQMENQARQRVLNQIRADWARVKDEQDNLKSIQDSKRAVSADLRARVDERRETELNQVDQRVEALRNRRIQMETEKLNKQYDMARTEINRQATKERSQMHHWAKVNSDRMERENQQAAHNAAKQRAHLSRIQHFRDLEAQGQQHKTRTNQVLEQRNAMMMSSIFT